MKRVRLSIACSGVLAEEGLPITTTHQLRCIIASIYSEKAEGKLSIYSREDIPSDADLRRTINQLREFHLISTDRDFRSGVFRINELPDGSCAEIVSLVDPFCYVSHLSAMEEYGLTDRISKAMIFSTHEPRNWRKAANEKLEADLNEFGKYLGGFTNLTINKHAVPNMVRGREVRMFSTRRLGKCVLKRGSQIRISSIGQVFADMVVEPNLCGGINHVIETWEAEAENYLEEIINEINKLKLKAAKVRAGYLLNERLGIDHPLIDEWQQFAQRGGSRKLDPTGDYRPPFSDRWMISINA